MEARRELKTVAAVDKENAQPGGLGGKRAVKPSRIPVPTSRLKSKPPSSHSHSSHPTRTLQPKQAVVPSLLNSRSTHPHPRSSHPHSTHPHSSHSQKTPTPKPSNRRPPRPTITATPSKVKPVPDFRKLHKEWNKKLEKKKEDNKTSIQLQPFAITPLKCRAGSCHEDVVSPEESRSPFEVDLSSMKEIFSEPKVVQSHRATIVGGGEQHLAGKYALAKTPLRIDSSTRLSFYNRRNTVCNTKGALTEAQPSSMLDGFTKLLERVYHTTLSRERSKAATSEGGRFTDIQLDLRPQFAQAEEKTAVVHTCKPTINEQLSTSNPHPSTYHPPPHTSEPTSLIPQLPTSRPHPSTHHMHPPPLATHKTAPVTVLPRKHPDSHGGASGHGEPLGKTLETRQSAFKPISQDFEEELCLLQDRWPTLPTASRPECGDPVAETLMKRREKNGFIPISTHL